MSIVLNGQVGLQSSRQMLAAAGKLFVATNPTPGTAIAYANKTAFSATANGLFSISNGNPSGGASLYLDRLKLTQTATAPTGTLVMRAEVYTESGIMVIGTAVAAVTPVNLNSGYPSTTGAVVTFFDTGAGTVPASVGSRRLVGIGSIATGVTVIHDSFAFEFGADGPHLGKVGLTAARATDPADLSTWLPPVVVAPQSSAYMNLWWVTSAANVPSFEFSLVYAEL